MKALSQRTEISYIEELLIGPGDSNRTGTCSKWQRQVISPPRQSHAGRQLKFNSTIQIRPHLANEERFWGQDNY